MPPKEEFINCPNGCGARLFYKEVTSHVTTTCPERKELCAAGCGALVRHKDRNKHLVAFCDFRVVKCKYEPKCRWSGRAIDLKLHLDNSVSTDEKNKIVLGDPYIECLERPYTCWHTPLMCPPQMPGINGYKTRWVGCGHQVRFGDREKHEKAECMFRQEECRLGCGRVITGFRVDEHLSGKKPERCADVAAWVESGCGEREVVCQYVLGKLKEGAKQEEAQEEVPAKGKKGTKKGKSTKTERTKSDPKDEERLPADPDRPLSPMSMFAAEERRADMKLLAQMDIRIEHGCGKTFKAKDLLEHQRSECPERFVLCKHGCGEMVKAKLMTDHEDSQHFIQTDLHLAAGDGNLEKVKDHIEGRDSNRKFSILVRDEDGNCALHYAAGKCQDLVIKYLLDQKADPNVQGSEGRTPLMDAAIAGDVGICQQLLNAKADLNTQDTWNGWTVLHHASFHKQGNVVKTILRGRPDLDVQDARRKDTPLHIALIAGDEEIVQELVDAGADLNQKNNRRVNVFYHTFNKFSGRPKEVRRGDVPFDMARSDYTRKITRPDLDEELQAINAKQGLDPLYGNKFTDTKSKREQSPAKLRALGRSLSPEKELGVSSLSPSKRSPSPTKAATLE